MASFPNQDTIRRQELANGITVLAYESFATQSVVVTGDLRVGAVFDPADAAGLSEFTSDMLLRGTANRSFEAIYDTLESVGARLTFGSGRLLTDFNGMALAEDMPLLLELAADALIRPTFPTDHVQRVRGELLTALAMQANNTRRMAGKRFRELLYGDHPFGRSTLGTPESVSAIDSAQLRAFHAAHYGPRGAIITVVGARPAAEMIDLVARYFGDWQADNPPLPTVADVARPVGIVREHVEMAEKSQTDIVLGVPGPRRADPNYLDIRVANTILGVFGMSGRIGKNVREKQGLAYYAYSSLSGGLGPSPWLVATGVAPKDVERAVDTIRAEIRRIQHEPVAAEELADTQAYLTGSMPLGLETNGGIAETLANMELYDLGLDYLTTYADRIRGVTVEKVQEMAQIYFSADDIAIATAGTTAADVAAGATLTATASA